MAVDILMATFNGERHLRNQLLSLQQQSHGDWTLWIHDDGSTDGTVALVESFARSDPRIRPLTADGGPGLGAARSFFGLVAHAASDYAIFCDQDDIWFEKKLEILLDYATRNFDPRLPCCVYCDGYGYSDREGVISVPSISRLHARRLEEFLFFNAGYQGCSLLFNRAMCDFIGDYRAGHVHMHDDIVSLVGHVFGQVHFVPKRLMLYRQHEANVTGNIADGLLTRLRRLSARDAFVLSRVHYEEKKAFYEAYRDRLDERSRSVFEAYLAFPTKGLAGRLWLVVRRDFSLGGHRLPLLVKTILRRPIG